MLTSRLALVTTLASGCTAVDLEDGAAGVARLTVRNAASLVELATDDAQCGFESPIVRDGVVVRGELGREGEAIWTVTGCALDLTEAPEVLTDCNGVTRTVSGKVTFSGTLTVRGKLTGQRDTPVIPAGPSATTIRLRFEFQDLGVVPSNDRRRLLMRDGVLEVLALPRLARSASADVCSVQTSNLVFERLQYDNANLFLEDLDGPSAHLYVPTSNIRARVGRTAVGENTIDGEINLFTLAVKLPVKGDDDVLDPDYEPNDFETSFSCRDDLAQPVSYQCGLRDDDLAVGVSRLTVQNVAGLVALLSTDSVCGFASPNVASEATTEGEVGRVGTWTARTEGCVLSRPWPTVLDTDCLGRSTVVGGRVVVTAEQRIEGWLTGDPFAPIIPRRDDAITVALESVTLDGFRVATGTASDHLVMHSGTLSATVTPRVAARAEDGVCAVATPNLELRDVRLDDAVLGLETNALRIAVTAQSARLDAVVGVVGGQANTLSGAITVSEQSYDLTGANRRVVDPLFDRVELDERWTCREEVAKPVSFICDPLPLLVDGSARLTMSTLDTLRLLIERDDVCGFASSAARAAAVVEGPVGGEGAVRWTLPEPCELTFSVRRFVEEDCLGNQTFVEGRARISGMRTQTGSITGDLDRPVIPTTATSLRYDLEADLFDFHVTTGDREAPSLEVRTGRLRGTVRPRGLLEGGICDVPGKDAVFSDVGYEDARLGVGIGDLVLDIDVRSADLFAVAGRYEGSGENLILGVMQAEGTPWVIPVDPRVPELDPDYDRQTFEAQQSCPVGRTVPRSDADCSIQQ